MELRNEETQVLGLINTINLNNHHRLIEAVGLRSRDVAIRLQNQRLETLEDLAAALGEDAAPVVSWAYDKCVEREQAKAEKNAKVFERRSANRALYLPEALMQWRAVVDRESGEVLKKGWRFDTELLSAGLMKRVVMARHGQTPWPVALSFLDQVADPKEPIPYSQWETMKDNGVVTSGGRLGWVTAAPAYQWLLKCFPKAIDFRSYNHSLNAPLLPGGLLMDTKVRLTTIRDLNGNPVGADGSGRIHPDHPLFEQLQRSQRVCAFQFRAFNEKGLFLKGILVPDERCVGDDGAPEIWIDWLQVKGAHKSHAKKMRDRNHYTTVHLGVLQNVWDRDKTIALSFEQIENLRMSGKMLKVRARKKQTGELVEDVLSNLTYHEVEMDMTEYHLKSMINEAMDELRVKGVDGLLAEVAQQDEQIALMLRVISHMRDRGLDFNPMNVQMIQEAVITRLQKRLYRIAQGAGVQGRQLVTVIDNSIKRGQCVCAHYPVGVKLAAWRYPTVLAQGLVTLRNSKPKSYHCVEGKGLKQVIYMNEADLVTCMQGDDDGDIIGVSDDQRLIDLFEYKVDTRKYHVEPEGQKFNTASDSPEGRRYIAGNPMGPVGVYTVFRAELLAAGDIHGANAMSILIQEAVDSAKNVVAWSDFRAAANLANWEQRDDGYHFNIKLGDSCPDAFDEDGDLDIGFVSEWVTQRLLSFGVEKYRRTNEGRVRWQSPVGWRYPNKRIDPTSWEDTVDRSGPGKWDGGNLVHMCHDYARRRWQEIAQEFDFSSTEDSPEMLIHLLMASAGIVCEPPAMTWPQYGKLRQRSGLSEYSNKVRKIMQRNTTDALQSELLEAAHQELVLRLSMLTIQELSTIWYMETSHPKGNITHAFRAVAWHGSPVMVMLGDKNADCPFMTEERLKTIVDYCLNQDNPHETLAQLILKSNKHGQEIQDENGRPVHGRDCQHCCQKMQTGLVRAIRAKKSEELEWVKNLTRSVNAN